ncbi:lipoprotein [Planoprotostelium fungivorum]|uniref:Lipoprotein n=1 Tax=Planoprotostelium fungivorum TaxID=1890364 RepID=A0A2P6NSS2_9EUKA|nr:lipoprotein [Planoprotostelium fungivorum]
MNTRMNLLFFFMVATATATNDNAAVNLLGIDGGTPNILYNFLASSPALVKSATTIQGLSSGESLLAIAKYPNTTNFYGLSNLKKVHQLDTSTARATYISTLSCQFLHSNPTLSIDFNPANGQLHIITLIAEQTSNHFVANAFDGECQSLPSLSYSQTSSYSTPSSAGVAFYNGKPYIIDANANSILSTLSGNTLTPVGPLNHQFSGVGGFAIAASSGRYFGLAALYQPYSSAFWAINLNSGAAYEAASLSNIQTNLIGFAVMSNGEGVDYPFPYLGTQYQSGGTYTYSTQTGTEDLFGTQPAATGASGSGASGSGASGSGASGSGASGSGATGSGATGSGASGSGSSGSGASGSASGSGASGSGASGSGASGSGASGSGASGSGATGSGASGSGASGSGASGSGATGSGATGSGATGSGASGSGASGTATGTASSGATGTSSSGSGSSGTATNTNTGSSGNSGTNTDGSGSIPSTIGTSSFTSTITTSDNGASTGSTSTNVGTFFPVGTSITQDVTFTETIAAYDYRGVSRSVQATVVLPSQTSESPKAAFLGTVLVGQGTATVVEEAGIAFDNGVTATSSVQDGTATRGAVVLLNGAEEITVGQLSDVSAGQTSATARVTLADAQGRTSNAVASFVLPSEGTTLGSSIGTISPTGLGRDQGSAGLLTASLLSMVVAVVMVL